MPAIEVVLAGVGEVAHVRTLRRAGVTDAQIQRAAAHGRIERVRPGWYASHLADVDQWRAVLTRSKIGCVSALSRFGVWSGFSQELHLHVPRSASHLDERPAIPVRGASLGVWHPRTPERRREHRFVPLSSSSSSNLKSSSSSNSNANPTQEQEQKPLRHWSIERRPESALDWIVSPHTALAQAIRCQDRENSAAVIDSVLHERVLGLREVRSIVRSLPRGVHDRIDAYTGHPESGAESLFIRRLVDEGFDVVPQFNLEPHGRYDGVINGCVLFEVDGRGFHNSAEQFLDDRDRTLVGQAFGIPVVRPSAKHVFEHWPSTLATVERVVADAEIVRAARSLPPIVLPRP
ncbi:hypothetical protein J7E25_08070 [Agromyces sp. ISL-38]|uniref:hypothetical protein n=1 Tax=Agromyces sp. ISL-38 TaxID=2819107 RepID=UPI001BECFC63|nr:hypothetical protein [Agromyces sp. ISL-38]MBT2499050.1 hypothetical protein [Agromyces sp. ISL-38]